MSKFFCPNKSAQATKTNAIFIQFLLNQKGNAIQLNMQNTEVKFLLLIFY